MQPTMAFLFPGQGSQYVGMGKEFAERFTFSRAIFAEADHVLGYPLSELIWSGPAEQLKKTVYTQPAILTTSMAILVAYQDQMPRPQYVLGHSLGEYTALVAAGVLTFADALRLVRIRGQLMETAVPAGKGGMAAVIGLARSELQSICEEVSDGKELVELANMNTANQIVISGTIAGLKQAAALAEARGAKRVQMLEVSGPFHSSLMRPAAERFADSLAEITFRVPQVPVISNVTARPLLNPEDIRAMLIRQMYSPVLWEDSIRFLLDNGVNTFYELGAGTVLSGLVKRIRRTAHVRSIHQPIELQQVEV